VTDNSNKTLAYYGICQFTGNTLLTLNVLLNIRIVMKLFKKLDCLSLHKPFEPSLMFVGKSRSLPKGSAPMRFTWVGAPLRFLTLPMNIRLCLKDLSEINALT
jgi:hypothetical protein